MVTFSDGQAGSTLETANNLTAWTSTSSNLGGAIAASNTVSLSGSWSIKASQDASSTWGGTHATKTIANVRTYYMRGYHYIDDLGAANGKEIVFMRLDIDTDVPGASIGIYRTGGVTKWALFHRHNAAMVRTTIDTPAPVVNTWCCLEIKLTMSTANDADNGDVEGYVDGTQYWNIDNIDASQPWNYSVIKSAIAGRRIVSGGTNFTGNNYIDDIVVDTSYIGPLSSGIQKYCLINEMNY